MTTQETIHSYFAAWNQRDAKALAELLPQGTYQDPTTRIAVHGYALDAVMATLAAYLPDYLFEIGSLVTAGSQASVTWTLTGTNTASFKPGIDPTGKKAHLSGVDCIELNNGTLSKVTRFFDQKSLYEQIGMQVIVEPFNQGHATYGYSKRVASGNTKAPAVIALTWIRFRNQSELDRIRAHSARIIQDFLAEPGFISIVTGAAGDRAFTVTAWESEDTLYRALGHGHSHAKQDFRTGDVSPGVWTSVWKPQHINRLWTRCPSCAQPNDASDNRASCTNCGTALPERPLYW